MPQQFNWLDVTEDESRKNRRPDPNDWRYYWWAGDDEWGARQLGLRQDPVYAAPEPVAPKAVQQQVQVPEEEDTRTPGVKFAQGISSVFNALMTGPKNLELSRIYSGAGGYNKNPPPQSVVRAASDFTRGAVYGIPQTVADIGGSIADIVTGNTGRGQSYTLQGNRPEDYYDAGGIAATVGAFAPDIALAIGTFGTSMAASSAMAASKYGKIARLGRLATGAADASPKAITMFGRAISPAATRAERVAATLAGAIPTATNVAPEVVSGRMGVTEGALMTAFGGLGGTLAAGQWGGSALANVLSDMGVNMATQAASEAVTLLPGGAEFDAAQAWKNMLYGAGLGAAFGVMNARPIQGQGQRAVLGQPVAEGPMAAPPPSAPAMASMGGASKQVEVARNVEAMLFGEPRTPFDATIAQANEALTALRQADISQIRSIVPDETGAIRSISDIELRNEASQAFPGVPASAVIQAAEIERAAYANNLAAEFRANPEVLARVLDLEIAPGEITPENAQQVLADKINNEWLVQAANGKGIGAVEQRLQQAGLRQAPQPQPVAEGGLPVPESVPAVAGPAAIIPEGGGPIQAPESSVIGRTPLLSERATPAQNAAIVPSTLSQLREDLGGYMPPLQTAENLATLERLGRGESPLIQLPESSAPAQGAATLPEGVTPEVAGAVEQARLTSALTGIPIEEIVPADSPVLAAHQAMEQAEGAATLTPEAAPTGEVAPTVEAAPIEAIPTAEKPKRKRIARQSARNETEAEVLDAIAEAADTKVYSTESAVASTDVRDVAANKAGQKIAQLIDRVELIKTEARQQGRTAVKKLETIQQLLRGNGAVIELYPNRKGGRSKAEEEMLASMSDMSIPEFRQALVDGRTDFAGGTISITKGEGANYNVVFTDKNILSVVEDAFLATRNGATPEVKENVAARREAKSKIDRLYGTSEEIAAIFDEEVSLNRIYQEAPDDISYEARSEYARDYDGDLQDGPEYINEGLRQDQVKGQWRSRFSNGISTATSEVIDTLKSLKQWDGLGVSPVEIKNQLLSMMAPGRWTEVGTKFLEQRVEPETRAKIAEAVNTAINDIYRRTGGAGKRTSIDRLMQLSAEIPDSYFDKMYDRYVPKLEEAQSYAETIAQKIGLEDPRDIWRYIEWQNAGKRPSAKRKLLDEWQETTMEPVAFDDARATAIAEQLDPLMKTDGDVLYAYDQLGTYVKERKGAEAYLSILDYNLSGGQKTPKMRLRDIPTLRNTALISTLYGLDTYAETIEDDETYAGIPGSTLKAFLGDGQTTSYAMMGLFGASMKVNNKHGQRTGYRARAGDALRQAAYSIGRMGGDHRAVSRLAIDQQNVLADNYMAKKYPSLKPGTDAYETEKAAYLNAQKYADLSGGKVTDIATEKTRGTVGLVSHYLADINLLAQRSQFFKDFIVEPYNQLQTQVRRLIKTVEDPINEVMPTLIKNQKNNPKFWDAIWIGADYRMSELQLSEGQLSTKAAAAARDEVMDEIKRDYFTEEGKFDSAGWDDFLSFQRAVDSLRKEDLRGLLAKSMGINSWEIESHYGELKLSKDATLEAFGAAQEARDMASEKLKALTDQYNNIVKAQGKEAAIQKMPGFKESREQFLDAKAQAQSNVNRLGNELRRIDMRMSRIEELDAMTQKSMTNMYMYRHRDGKASFVVRLQFDESLGLPSVRREYATLEEAELGQAEYLRDAVMAKTKKMPEYLRFLNKRKALQDELAALSDGENYTPETDARISAINKELDALEGYKSVSEMTDAEVMRFAQTYEVLGSKQTIQDMRRRLTGKKGSAMANALLDQIIATSDPVKAQILSRTADTGSITPRYVEGKGNATLAEVTNPDVVFFSGDDAPTVQEIMDAIGDRVDAPIDTTQMRELLERNYTYREKTKAPNGTQINTIWIDMGALRNVVDAVLEPYVPNLTKRNNWVGYYDPKGAWTVDQKIAYTVQSLESMMSRIKNYNQQTALRRTVADSLDYLNKYDINNGLREYIGAMQHYNDPAFNEGVLATLDNAAANFSRYVSVGTLFSNVGSAIGNRIQGATIAFSHGLQNASTRYGVRKMNADGTEGEIQWMPSEMAADALIASEQAKGNSNLRRVEGFKWRGLVNPLNYGYGVAAMTFPGTTLRLLAAKDGWGTKPPSQQGYWALVYEAQRKANLKEGSVVGSYAVREGIETGLLKQNATKAATFITSMIERANNSSSILMAAADSQNKFGMTAVDWQTLNLGQRTSVIDQALLPHQQRLQASGATRDLLQKEIAELNQRKSVVTNLEAQQIQKQIDSKVERLSRVADEKSVLYDALTEYLVYNRGYDQGNWDMMSKAKFERMLLSLPGGRLGMTMTAPILRAMNSWQGLWRRAGATEGGRGGKIGRAAAPLLGAGILTTLLGGAASTAVGLGGIFLADMAHLGEYLYHYFSEEENEKLDKIAPRQVWEKLAEDMAPRYGINGKDAREFVRKYWSEGLIRYYRDVNISAGNGIFDIATGGTPAQVVPANAKAAYDAISNFISSFGAATPYDFVYGLSNAMPTSAKRAIQVGAMFIPPSLGGQGAVKVDKQGNPIIDQFTGQPQYLDGYDITRQLFLGKPWKDTRSMLVARENGTPLYTPNDRAAWANDLARGMKYLNFGKAGGPTEALNAARFERDAEDLQRVITNKYRAYKDATLDSKNHILDMYKNNELIGIGNGESRSFRQILAETATSGIIPETELKGKGASSVLEKVLKDVDDWARARSTYEAIIDYYGEETGAEVSDDITNYPAGYQFALIKLGRSYRKAYQQGAIRRAARERIR